MLKLFQEWGKKEIKENAEGGELTMIYSKKFYKFHNVSPIQH
jgi:hypothetical protein